MEENSKGQKSTKLKTNIKIDKDKIQFFQIISKIENPQLD